MKERLLVMNGTRFAQTEMNGAWTSSSVERAGALRPGLYNLYTAQPADRSKSYSGTVLYANERSVYQQVGGKTIVTHARADFDKVPEAGEAVTIRYGAKGPAEVIPEIQAVQRRSRSL